jgi:AAHS family 4-hydroxybenzoate transporter-like MFS transporter
MFFMNLLDLFFLQNWIPILTNAEGVALRTAVFIGALFQLGGVIAAPIIGLVVARYGGCRVLPVLYGAGAITVALLGQAGASVPALTLLTFGAGVCLVGAQNSANAVAAMFYDTAIRATGVGWSLGIGRIGAIIGPLIAGFLISLHWPNGSIFLLGGLPMACAMTAALVMGRIYGADPSRRAATPQPTARAAV